MNILEEILAEIKGLRADMEASDRESKIWAKEQADYQKSVLDEAAERHRRMELEYARHRGSA